MVKIPFAKLISVIWGVILAFFIAKALIDTVVQLSDYFAFSAADIISRDVGGRIATILGIPGNVTLSYKFSKNMQYNLTITRNVVCAESKGMLIPTHECKITLVNLPEEYSFAESGIEIIINKTLINGKYTLLVEKK
jgi:hypothetical protein